MAIDLLVLLALNNYEISIARNIPNEKTKQIRGH